MSKSQSTHNNLLMCQIPVNLENLDFGAKLVQKRLNRKKN